MCKNINSLNKLVFLFFYNYKKIKIINQKNNFPLVKNRPDYFIINKFIVLLYFLGIINKKLLYHNCYFSWYKTYLNKNNIINIKLFENKLEFDKSYSFMKLDKNNLDKKLLVLKEFIIKKSLIKFFNVYLKLKNHKHFFFVKKFKINNFIFLSTTFKFKLNFDNFYEKFSKFNNSSILTTSTKKYLFNYHLIDYKPINYKFFNTVFLRFNFNFFLIVSRQIKKLFFYNVFKNKIKIINFLKYFLKLEDFSILGANSNLFSNTYLINFFNIFNYNTKKINFIPEKKKKHHYYNNYYPAILFEGESYNIFFNVFKQTYNTNHINILNKTFINFFESFFHKKIYIKIDNNFFNQIKNPLFIKLCENYKNFHPIYFKNFLFSDFLQIIWYAFYLKDLSILSEWISIFMEHLKFRSHKKFVFLFQNFMIKNYGLFCDVLGIKGFLFDIRGKVGVTGSSKKRHLCFKLGYLKKSSKKNKIGFNQSLVRTYSGVMGLTYIISF